MLAAPDRVRDGRLGRQRPPPCSVAIFWLLRPRPAQPTFRNAPPVIDSAVAGRRQKKVQVSG
jgi:hypothetical protein